MRLEKISESREAVNARTQALLRGLALGFPLYFAYPFWVWHVGLYLGDGRYVVGDHHAGKTVIEPLLPYLEAHQDEYSGVFVTRGPAKKPTKCRQHAPLAPARR